MHHVDEKIFCMLKKKQNPLPFQFGNVRVELMAIFLKLCGLERGQQSSRFYVPPVVLFLLCFLLSTYLSLSVSEGSYDLISFASGNKQKEWKGKRVL